MGTASHAVVVYTTGLAPADVHGIPCHGMVAMKEEYRIALRVLIHLPGQLIRPLPAALAADGLMANPMTASTAATHGAIQ